MAKILTDVQGHPKKFVVEAGEKQVVCDTLAEAQQVMNELSKNRGPGG